MLSAVRRRSSSGQRSASYNLVVIGSQHSGYRFRAEPCKYAFLSQSSCVTELSLIVLWRTGKHSSGARIRSIRALAFEDVRENAILLGDSRDRSVFEDSWTPASQIRSSDGNRGDLPSNTPLPIWLSVSHTSVFYKLHLICLNVATMYMSLLMVFQVATKKKSLGRLHVWGKLGLKSRRVKVRLSRSWVSSSLLWNYIVYALILFAHLRSRFCEA